MEPELHGGERTVTGYQVGYTAGLIVCIGVGIYMYLVGIWIEALKRKYTHD